LLDHDLIDLFYSFLHLFYQAKINKKDIEFFYHLLNIPSARGILFDKLVLTFYKVMENINELGER
jgi:hypothetical protein